MHCKGPHANVCKAKEQDNFEHHLHKAFCHQTASGLHPVAHLDHTYIITSSTCSTENELRLHHFFLKITILQSLHESEKEC